MHDEQLREALDCLVPRAPGGQPGHDVAWKDVQRRARLVRVRRRSLIALMMTCAILFSTLAASGEIGSFVSHSKAPHLLIRGTLYTQDGRRAGSLEIELERAMIARGRPVRVFGWRLPHEHNFRARWFLDLRPAGVPLGRASLVFGGAPQRLCGPCGARSSAELEVTPAQAAELVNDEVTFRGEDAHAAVVSGSVRLDRSNLHRAVMCVGASACTRIYSGRP